MQVFSMIAKSKEGGHTIIGRHTHTSVEAAAAACKAS